MLKCRAQIFGSSFKEMVAVFCLCILRTEKESGRSLSERIVCLRDNALGKIAAFPAQQTPEKGSGRLSQMFNKSEVSEVQNT